MKNMGTKFEKQKSSRIVLCTISFMGELNNFLYLRVIIVWTVILENWGKNLT